jgi:ureidoglycolate hydrolase
LAKLHLKSLIHLSYAIAANAQIIQGVTGTIEMHPLSSQAFYPTAADGIAKAVD